MVGVSASVNLPLHHKVQKFSSGTGSLGWSRKKGRKMVVVVTSALLHYLANAETQNSIFSLKRCIAALPDFQQVAGLIDAVLLSATCTHAAVPKSCSQLS